MQFWYLSSRRISRFIWNIKFLSILSFFLPCYTVVFWCGLGKRDTFSSRQMQEERKRMRVDWRNTFLPGKGWLACFLISVTFSVGLAATCTFDLAAFLVSMGAFHMPNWPVRDQWENLRKLEQHFPIKPNSLIINY